MPRYEIWKIRSMFRRIFCVWKRSRSKAENSRSGAGIHRRAMRHRS
jgi:hypothetical protein